MSDIDEEKLTQRQRYWLEQLRACEASGKTMRAYAAEIGIGERAFYDAKKRLVKRGVLNSAVRRRREIGFVHAQIVDAAHRGGCRIQFPNGITVSFPALESEGLAQMLRMVAMLG